MLTEHQKTRYHEDGFIILPNFKSAAEIAAVRARAEAIVEAFNPADSKTIFTTNDQVRQVDRYFVDSANRISCFFEEEAFDADGELRQAKALSINKIGHALHDQDPVFNAFSHGAALAEVAADVGLIQPQVWQSMYIFKQPSIGGEVGWHQDATFFDTTPISVTTFWFALEDATLDNGCLWTEPGGHRGPRGVLRERFERDGDVITMRKLDATPWPASNVSVTPLEVKAGALIIFHGLLPHYSAPNRSAVSRHAYTLHATDASTAYAPSNWIQRGTNSPVRGFV